MKRKIKLILITKYFPPRIGGVPNFYGNIIANLKEIKLTVLTKAMKKSESYDTLLANKGVKIERVNCFAENMRLTLSLHWLISMCRIIFKIIEQIRKTKAEFLIVGQVKMFLLIPAYLIKIITGKPYILFLHGEEIPQIQMKSNGLLRFFYNHAFSYICNSKFTVERLKEFSGAKLKNISIVTPAVEDRFFEKVTCEAIEDKKRQLGFKNKRVIYTIARLDLRKGQDKVIEAMPKVLERFSDAIYLIGGEGPNLENLKQLVKKLNLQDRVRFIGLVPREEIVTYHHIGEIYIMANRTLEDGDTEGFGIVFLEANACGKPVIGGRAGGAVDAIEDGLSGLLCNSSDPNDIAEKICWLLENKEKAREIGSKGRERALKNFRWEHKSHAFEKIFDKSRPIENAVYSVKKFNTQKDKADLLSIWKKGLDRGTADRFEWMYELDFHCEVLTWLLRYKNKQVVGAASFFKRSFNINNRLISLGINVDMIVEKRHRTLIPAIILLNNIKLQSENHNCEALLAMPNKKSEPIFKKSGYVKIGSAYRWSKVLRSEEKFSGRIKSLFLRKIISKLFDIYSASMGWCGLFYRWKFYFYKKRFKGIISFAGNFEINKAYSPVKTMDCSPEYFHWRYNPKTGSNSQVFALYNKEQLIGFVIYYQKEKHIVVEDICVCDKELFKVLLIYFIDKMNVLKMSSVSILFFGKKYAKDVFIKLGFFKRQSRSVFLYSSDEDIHDELQNENLFCLFDGDLDL